MLSFLSDVLYSLTILLVRVIKRIELLLLLPFTSVLENFIRDLYKEAGVVFHRTDDSFRSWTKENEREILNKFPTYDRVIHLKVNSKYFFAKLANDTLVGLGRGFMEKEWELLGPLDDFHEMIYRCLRLEKLVKYIHNPWAKFLNYLEFNLFNTHQRKNMFTEVNQHYNLGNDLFQIFLDPLMQYSNAYWGRGAKSLDEAQLQKLELIAQKLDLKPGMKVLEIGCGWGMLSKFLAERHGVDCVGLTISKEGAAFGRKVCAGLPVEIRVQDYRDIDEKFDRVVSIEMIEHAGCHNYHDFFKVAHRCLKNDGLLLIQFSTWSQDKITPFRNHSWLHEYVFPHLNFPFLWEMSKESSDLFRIEDFHNITPGFYKVFLEWQEKLVKRKDEVVSKYGETFYRMFLVYFSVSIGVSKSGLGQSWQIAYSKGGMPNSYKPVR